MSVASIRNPPPLAYQRANRRFALFLATGIAITVTSLVLLTLSLTTSDSSFLNTTAAYAYGATLAIGVLQIAITLKKAPKKIQSIPSSEILINPKIEPAIIRRTTAPMQLRPKPEDDLVTFETYLQQRKRQFTARKISSDVDEYMFSSLREICRAFSINPIAASDADLNVIFQCLALQILQESTIESGPACDKERLELAIKDSFKFKEPFSLLKPVTPGTTSPLELVYVDPYLGEISSTVVKKTTGYPTIQMRRLHASIEGYSPQLVAKHLQSYSKTFGELRLFAYQLCFGTWSKFLSTIHSKKTATDFISETLQKSYKEARDERYVTTEEISMGYAPHVQQIALLDIIKDLRYSETPKDKKLELPNGQTITIPKYEVRYNPIEQSKVASYCPFHPFAFIDTENWKNSITDEIFQLRILFNEHPHLLMQIRSGIIAQHKTPSIPFEPSGNAIKAMELLNKLNNAFEQTYATVIGKAMVSLSEAAPSITSQYFSNEQEYLTFFKSFYHLNPRRVGGSCLMDALCFYLSNGISSEYNKLLADDRKYTAYIAGLPCHVHYRYDKDYNIEKLKGRLLKEFGIHFRDHQSPNSPLGIGRQIGLLLEQPSNARLFLDYVAKKDWVECSPGASDHVKIHKIIDHAKHVYEGDVWSGEPELRLFGQMNMAPIHIFEGNPYARFKVNLDAKGQPIPDRILADHYCNEGVRPIVMILAKEHFTGAVKKP